MLEGKPFGIFSLLDEECRMPIPKTTSFIQKVITKHKNWPNKTASNNENCFVIQHFGHKVQYKTDNFIERNTELYPKLLKNLADEALKPFHFRCTSATNSITEPNIDRASGNKQSTFSAKFRSDLNLLISELKLTVSEIQRTLLL